MTKITSSGFIRTTRPSSKPVKALKIVLSLFIIYHLCAVLLMPVGSSLPGRKLGRYFLDYASTLGFNTTWSFFSPAPSPSFFLQYDADLKDGTEANGGQPMYYPPQRADNVSWDDGWNRRLYGMRFFALDKERLERFFVPFLCRQVPGAQTIYVQSVFEKIEDLEKAGTWTDLKDSGERVDLPRQRYTCPDSPIGASS